MPEGPLPEPLASSVEELERGFSGTLGLWVHDLRRREMYGLRAEETFDPASTIKLFVLLELYRQAEAGRADLDEEVTMEERDVTRGSGVLKDLTPGRVRLTLRDAAVLMVTVSDNTATNLLIDRLGPGAINRTSWNAGFRGTWLQGRLRWSRARRSRTTPRDLGTLLTKLARHQLVSRPASTAMRDILRREQSDTIVGRLLPDDTYDRTGRRRTWKVASKSGSILGHRHDAALVEGQGLRYVIVLMSRDCQDTRFTVDNEASVCLAHAARAVHDHIAGRTTGRR